MGAFAPEIVPHLLKARTIEKTSDGNETDDSNSFQICLAR